MRRLLTALVPLALVACTQASPPETTEPETAAPEAATETAPAAEEPMGTTGVPLSQEIAEGREIASHQCANCHGLDKEDALRADAPPLRNILSIYDADTLKENFEAGLKVGHPDMPDFVFGPLGADVLLSYLESVQEPLPESTE